MNRLIFYGIIFFLGQQEINASERESVANIVTLAMRLRGVSVVEISCDRHHVYTHINVEKSGKDFEREEVAFFPKPENKDSIYLVSVDGQGRRCYFYPGNKYTIIINENNYIYTRDGKDKK